MANKFLKPSVIANASAGLLLPELVVARTVWTDAVNPGEFVGALDDTVSLRVPARRTSRKRTLRAGTTIVNDVSNEYSVPVKLDTDVYNGAPITDEELTLDIVDFGKQILRPQVLAVAEGVEDEIIDEIEGATYAAGMTIDPTDTEYVVSGETDWYLVALGASKALDLKNVPSGDRYLIVGTNVKYGILSSDRFSKYNEVGPDAADALRRASLGRIANFEVVHSTKIDPDAAYGYHRTAFVLATRAPAVPRGVAFAQIQAANGETAFYNGMSIRWLQDYDYTNTTNRSLVNTYVGTATVKDPVDIANPNSTMRLDRAVKIVEGS
ncbi:MAG: P22 phage major capsid protein family protein [Patulibacter sp.]|nr:P22 phage major capsid protein family protein [Patulibacter sp.]